MERMVGENVKENENRVELDLMESKNNRQNRRENSRGGKKMNSQTRWS